ncbi:DUF3945 domain-containing protein [Flavobacterium cupreum]|uniref:DUF3945 domain-containing protein n=2 Tax=Flavobacterium TaxID=237 RepID=A0A4Y7UER6_9FLAO|nr:MULTISPECIES: DUF4099 domain-containing protein [Flavobacterium]RUT71524.1 DUF3945 domain-containing protein [Flavobacterium cupreum]TCN59646.1 uncharacterized protein DUF3945 [Flavobacterium circumlabens]TEB44917.1 DUF3945 domain-containing protein [Flavobacterium circumlabens]
MSEQEKPKQETPEQLTDILLVLDQEKMKIVDVKGIDKNGELETVPADKKNQNQFMRVDKQGDLLSNFFSNFFSQLKNPTRFNFFKVPQLLSVGIAAEMQKQIDNPKPEGEKLMKEYEVKMELQKDNKVENHKNMETTQTTTETSEYRFKPEQIDWDTMNNLGLSKEKLEKMNLLEPLLKGYKSNELVPISLNLGTAITRMDARLSLQSNEEGQVVVAIHGIRKEPTLNFPFFGHEFSKEDKDNLLKTGNMGRVVDLTNLKTGEPVPSIISVDRLTNELVALHVDKIKIPDEIKGIKLNEEQKQTLLEGKPLYIEGMISKKGDPFNATVQFNADKRYVEFQFDRTQSTGQTQNNQQQNQEVPKTIRGKELSEQQYEQFAAGKTIYVDGLVDKQGKEYKGYLTFNKDTGKAGFSFSNPNSVKVQPAEEHKTQTAVNSEGKTNEATKNSTEPLKSGQKEPDSKKQQEEQDNTPAKSKGRKM